VSTDDPFSCTSRAVTLRLTAQADEAPVVDRPRTEIVVAVPLPSVVASVRAAPLGWAMVLQEAPPSVVRASENEVAPTGAVGSRQVTRTGTDPVVGTVALSSETLT
jgi:hypothetical protein